MLAKETDDQGSGVPYGPIHCHEDLSLPVDVRPSVVEAKMKNQLNAQGIREQLVQIRKTRPLIHNITNYVVMNWTANCLLAIGASPVMAHAIEEIDDLLSISNALVINMGTLSAPWIESMSQAMNTARKKNIPIVFDPVGVGASSYRTVTARNLLAQNPAQIIRGNASEIIALAGIAATTKGVDSSAAPEKAIIAAELLCKTYGSVVCISGPTDFIVTNTKRIPITHGHPIMSQVTGMGCAGTAIIAAFCALKIPYIEAASQAMMLMGMAGEMAAAKSHGPGSFQSQFLDTLHNFGAYQL